MNYKSLTLFFKPPKDPRILALATLALALVFMLVVNVFPDSRKATLVIDLDGQKRIFEGETFKGMTILDAINISTNTGKITFIYALTADGVNIAALGDYSNTSLTDKFLFYLNSKPIAPSQINKIVIKAGDRIEIKAR